MELSDIDLTDPGNFVDGRPPRVVRRPPPGGAGLLARGARRPGFLVRHQVRRLRHRQPRLRALLVRRPATFLCDMHDEHLEQQRLMMLNMDPPLHTRYRRLVNKGFTPRMVRHLEEKIHDSTDAIIDAVIEQGPADFVDHIAAELPLQVIADLLGVPQEDRHMMFDWSNRMIGSEDPEYQITPDGEQPRRRWSSTPTRPSSTPRSGSIPTRTS